MEQDEVATLSSIKCLIDVLCVICSLLCCCHSFYSMMFLSADLREDVLQDNDIP